MNQQILTSIQQHTRTLYQLDSKHYEIKKVAARNLLHVSRFDLFAKLFYIRHKESAPQLARQVYCEHIKVFNPDLKEPGREDKQGMDKFIHTFDQLIADFATSEFDETKSIVPVDKNGVILDGAHRVAALAYYGKKVTIAQFDDVTSHGIFDYNYFLSRGLSFEIADIIALEATMWCKNLYAACLWPKVSQSADRERVKRFIRNNTSLVYEKKFLVSLSQLTRFVAQIYANQSWVGTEANHFKGARDKALQCYSSHKRFEILLFQSSLPLDDIIYMKETIRGHFNYGKHAIHITDNDAETRLLSDLVLDKTKRKEWLDDGGFFSLNSLYEKMSERILLFRYQYLIPFKTYVFRLLHP